MEFSPTITDNSKQFPGVSFTVQRMGIVPRTEIELKTADLRAKQREVQQALAPLIKADAAEDEQIRAIIERAQAAPAGESAAILEGIAPVEELLAAKPHYLERARLDEQARMLQRQVEAHWVRAGLVSLDGITVNGVPMTAEQLCSGGPRELFAEVYQAIYNEAYLSQEQAKNLRSLSISGPAEITGSENTTAPSARVSAVDGTHAEVAASCQAA